MPKTLPPIQVLLFLICAIQISPLLADCTYETELFGKNTNSGVMLSWSTAIEQNNNFFIVERSYDGLKFDRAIRIEAAGNSTEVKNYRFLDISQAATRTFYRLLQVDYDGSMQFSHTILVNKAAEDQQFQITALSSTQTERYFSLRLESKVAGQMEYRIMTRMGDLQEQGEYEVVKGTNRLSLDLSELAIGTYQFALKVNNEIEVFNLQKINSSELPGSNFAIKPSKQE